MPSNVSKLLFDDIRSSFAENRDPTTSTKKQSYMKSTIPFYGLKKPLLRKICYSIFEKYGLLDYELWTETILMMWETALFREELYAAIELVKWKPCHIYHTLEALPMIEKMIVTGAWWDFCDSLVDPLGTMFRNNSNEMRSIMSAWAKDSVMWKRRSAILCQLKFKHDLDFEFLKSCIEPNLSSKEFFIRKAIGWALRDYAWTNPQIVKDYVDVNFERLSGVSKREALKNMTKLLPLP